MYNINGQTRTSRQQAGFTLIEVLVSLLVLSIGLLGIASLQATSLRFNNDASMQTRAAYIAADMADRMRANSTLANTYPGEAGAANNNCYLPGGCGPASMVANDVAEWNQLLASLPAGQGDITALPVPGLYQITVRWDEARNGANGLGCDPDVPTDLRCLRIITRP